MKNFERKINCNKITFRYARGRSLITGDEIHPYFEVLYFMKGKATFLSEQFEKNLQESTLIIIPKETYHKVQIESRDDYTRLVLNFPDIPEFDSLINDVFTEIKIIENITSNIRYLIDRIIEVLSNEEKGEKNKVLLYSAFYMFLAELNVAKLSTITPVMRESDQLISRCIKYIDVNFNKDISVESISKEMLISGSSLQLYFKRRLGISVYKYITEKRLIFAHKLITNGAAPTKIYIDCGFNDYPTFYKAYIKMFGKSPSKDKL